MKKITLVSVPKGFERKHIGLIQENAIRSWKRLKGVKVILTGTEKGVKKIAKKYGCEWIGGLKTNREGTPYLNDVIHKAWKIADGDRVMYINADIVLLDDFVAAIEAVDKTNFLLVGKRTNMDITERLDLSATGRKILRKEVSTEGVLMRETAIDYFVFTKSTYKRIPPLLVGRAWFDNWMVWQARQSGVMVVDATKAVTAIHQNHDYGHHKAGKEGVYEGKEARYNKKIAGGGKKYATIRDASHLLIESDGRLELKLKMLSSWEEFKYFWLWTLPRINPVAAMIIIPFRSWMRKISRS